MDHAHLESACECRGVDECTKRLPCLLSGAAAEVELVRSVGGRRRTDGHGLLRNGIRDRIAVGPEPGDRHADAESAAADDDRVLAADLDDRPSDPELGRDDRIPGGERRYLRERLVGVADGPPCARGALGCCAETPVTLALLGERGRSRRALPVALELPGGADLVSQRLELATGVGQLALGAEHGFLALRLRGCTNPVDLLLELGDASLRRGPRSLRCRVLTRCALARLYRLTLRCLGLGKELGDPQPLGSDVRPRVVDDVGGEPEPLRDPQRM